MVITTATPVWAAHPRTTLLRIPPSAIHSCGGLPSSHGAPCVHSPAGLHYPLHDALSSSGGLGLGLDWGASLIAAVITSVTSWPSQGLTRAVRSIHGSMVQQLINLQLATNPTCLLHDPSTAPLFPLLRSPNMVVLPMMTIILRNDDTLEWIPWQPSICELGGFRCLLLTATGCD